ncbi:MAG: beta-lactamase family protein [Planctomycetales bacterium]|nr:beta-lactamase family protein [Planctomycetales bacterium]
MRRRTFLATSAAWAGLGSVGWLESARGAIAANRLEQAAGVLQKAADSGVLAAAAMLVQDEGETFTRAFGAAKSTDAVFLLASISKPIAMTALMTLYDQGKFQLDDAVQKFIPEFKGDGREQITIRHLLTHVSGLPDQLQENQALRKGHAPMAKFVSGAIRTPLLFKPASKYSYSSMGILLGAEIAQRISGATIHDLMRDSIFKPLGMTRSALGLGHLKLEETMQCQTASAAPESGAGSNAAKDWDWNSRYWREFGAPWGGAHASIIDLGRYFQEFLKPTGAVLRPETARMMIRNHNPECFEPRGLGFRVGPAAGSPGCSDATFGHTGSTGTLAWADPERNRVCLVLTTLPGAAMKPHPRQLVSDQIARA